MDTHASSYAAHRYSIEHRDAYGKLVDTWAGVCSHGDAMQRAARMIDAMFLGDVVSVGLTEEGERGRRVMQMDVG